jgi:DNA-binding NarL/FixJ family response regulator
LTGSGGYEKVADDLVMRSRVVLVDVRPERRALMRGVVEMAIGPGTVRAEVASGSEALAAVERHHADAVIVEIQLPVAEGLAVIAALRSAHPAVAILVCTFHHDRTTEREATEAGADAYLVKPVNARDVRAALGSVPLPPLADTAAR